jgi:DNA-binding NtrC family response regulator
VALIGQAPAMERLRRRIATVAPTPLPVLIQGETGTGKEVVARAVHEASGRTGPFVPVDCGALARSLVESELFGHEKGAFTGAAARREGLVSAARGGTFFLDEIGELPLEAQTRLLRLLENGTYRPVGGHDQHEADLRVVAATWRDLRAEVADGTFREDLYHRLAIVELAIPPLRDRDEDVLLLFDHFVRAHLPPERERVPVLDPAARAWLLGLDWPGNVRELRNAAQYVAAMVPGASIGLDDLPAQVRRERPVSRGSGSPSADVRIDLPYMEARRLFLDDFQLRYVAAQLAACDGNVSAAARAAGMDRRTIQRILAADRSDDPR